jgi:dolichol-phosphate mannosyltransferase
MKLSVVIPAHNEADSIVATVRGMTETLGGADVEHEVIVIDDGSGDATGSIVDEAFDGDPRVRCFRSHYARGFGFAVRAGLDRYEGDAVAIVMADGSDAPEDLVSYHRLLEEGYDCAFGSRWIHGGTVRDYPRFKLILNRIANWVIRVLFRHRYDDTTNAFKAYRREVIDGIQPLISNHFNLTVEMPLKAVVRGYSYGIVPISWTNRSSGESKLSLQEMGSRYLFIVLYAFLEHHLSRGDYERPELVGGRVASDSAPPRRAARARLKGVGRRSRARRPD